MGAEGGKERQRERKKGERGKRKRGECGEEKWEVDRGAKWFSFSPAAENGVRYDMYKLASALAVVVLLAGRVSRNIVCISLFLFFAIIFLNRVTQPHRRHLFLSQVTFFPFLHILLILV